MKTKRFLILVLSMLLIIDASTAVAEVVATIDRTSIALDETLTLTITRDSSSFFTDPELQPLEKDFKVLGQSQQSSTQIINGSASSSVTWTITLAPKRSGTLQIPAISVGKEKTAALTVQVSAEAPPKTSSDNVPIFIETDVDEQSVFVQSQVIYTLRIYWATDIQIIDPQEPDVADALLTKLDDTTFEKTIDGRKYRVFERKYALFPQKSGVMEIPQMVVQVNIPSRATRRNFFDPFGGRGEVIKFRSEAEKVTVKEKPEEYPASAVWLPSNALLLKDEWSKSPSELKVGESVTLSLSITADGLMAEQLPPVDLAEPDGMKLYQGKAEVENLTTSLGIVGTRKESIALIPTRPGDIEIPEIRIPWWDKKNRKVEYAVIPARKMVAKGPAGKPETQVPAVVQDTNTPAVPVPQAVQQSPGQTRPTLLIILCAVFGVGWLMTLLLLLYTRRQMNEFVQIQLNRGENERAMKERDAFHFFASACQENDPVKARASVISWAKTFWPKEKIQTFADITRIVADPDIMSLLREIDSILYRQEGESSGLWQGKNLLEKVKTIRKARDKKKNSTDELQKLYK